MLIASTMVGWLEGSWLFIVVVKVGFFAAEDVDATGVAGFDVVPGLALFLRVGDAAAPESR
jgi:hypothetical protein